MIDVPHRNFAGGLIALGPATVFAAVYLVAPVAEDQKIFVGTGAFMAAAVVAMIAAPFAPKILMAHMLQIPWLSSVLAIVMGGLALWLRDEAFIKMQPTLYFGLVAAWSGWTAAASIPRLQKFGKRDDLRRVSGVGWRKLTRYAAWACLLTALLNELIWRNSSTGFWIGFQLWGWVLIEMLVMVLSLPMLKRHGFSKAARSERRRQKGRPAFLLLVIDFGPLVAFVAAYAITPLSWVSRLLVVAMGGLTLWLRDDTFIKMKPTLQYGLATVLAGSSLLTGVPRLQRLMKSGNLGGLDQELVRKLFGHGIFASLSMALINEVIWRHCSTGFWVWFQLWGRFPITLLYAAAVFPILKRHGVLCKRPAGQDTISPE
jgi:intracellular septation protein